MTIYVIGQPLVTYYQNMHIKLIYEGYPFIHNITQKSLSIFNAGKQQKILSVWCFGYSL